MIHVCHMTSAHASDDTRIFYKECVSLAKAGYEVSLVARGPAREEAGVRVVGVGVPLRRPSFPDAVLLPAGYTGRRWHWTPRSTISMTRSCCHMDCGSKRRGKVVIFDSHEFTAQAILEKHWLPKPLRRIVYRLYQAYEASVCRRLDAVISVSPHIVDYFSKINPRTVQVTNYPIFREAPMPDDGGDARIIFAGGITPNGCTRRSSRPWRRCRSAAIPSAARWGGVPFPPGGTAWLGADRLPGPDPHGEVAKQMAHCRAGVALLRPGKNTNGHSGTMGNTKIFEEMMAGPPVICTDFSPVAGIRGAVSLRRVRRPGRCGPSGPGPCAACWSIRRKPVRWARMAAEPSGRHSTGAWRNRRCWGSIET